VPSIQALLKAYGQIPIQTESKVIEETILMVSELGPPAEFALGIGIGIAGIAIVISLISVFCYYWEKRTK